MLGPKNNSKLIIDSIRLTLNDSINIERYQYKKYISFTGFRISLSTKNMYVPKFLTLPFI